MKECGIVRIKSIYISNYKSYDDKGVEINFNNITGFVGANSTGKSNVLKAIDLFYRNSKIEEIDFHNKNTEKDIIIDITFSGCGKIDRIEEALLINKDELKLRRTIKWNEDKGQAEWVKQLIPICVWKYKGSIPELELFPKQKLNISKVRSFNSCEEGRAFYEAIGAIDAAESVNDFYDLLKRYFFNIYKEDKWNEYFEFVELPSIEKYKDLVSFVNTYIIEKLPEYIYLPIEQTISDELVSKRGTRLEYIFSKLMQYTKSENVRRQRHIDVIEKKIENYYKNFYDKKIDTLNNALNDAYVNWGISNSKLSINREMLNLNEMLEPSIKLMADDGFHSEISTKGTGEQRLAIFRFLQTYADFIGSAKNVNVILAIDEPELYLHPPYKRALYSMFRKLEKTFQIIYTTHDPIFVSLEYFDEIRIIRKKEELNSYISFVDWDKLSRFSNKIPEFKARNSKLSKRQVLFNKCHSEQNEGFFASKIILVEGNTEIYSLPIYFEELGFDINLENISLIASDGVESLKILYVIFTLFGIPTYVIFDGDKPLDSKECDTFYKIYPLNKNRYSEILNLLKSYEETKDDKIRSNIKKIKNIHKIFNAKKLDLFFSNQYTLSDIVDLNSKKYEDYNNKFSRNIKIHGLFSAELHDDGFSKCGIYERYTKWEYNFEENVSKKLNNYENLSTAAKKEVSGKPLIAKQIALSAVKEGLSEEFINIVEDLISKIRDIKLPGDIPTNTENNFIKSDYKIVLLPFAESEEMLNDRYNIFLCAGGPMNPFADEPINQAYGIVPPKTKFIVRITGDSMEPDISDNSYLAIEEDRVPAHNKIYIFYYDGNSICKLYNKGSDGKVRLVSLNRGVPPIEVKEDLICYGKVICGKDKKPIFLNVVDDIEE